MAVTIISEPVIWDTSDNPLPYVFESDEAGQPNFSFIIDVKVDSQVVYTDKVFLEVGDRAHFDASPVVRYMVNEPTIKTDLFEDAGISRTLQLVVTENYGDPAVNEASASSSVTNIWKARVSDRDFKVNDYDADYKLQKFFTDYPVDTDIEVLRDQVVSLSMLGGGSLAALNMEFFDSSGTVLHSYTSANQNFDIWQLNLSGSNLTATAGVPSISAVSYFTVEIGSSETRTIKYLDSYCHAPTSVVWMNRYGGFDTFLFKHSLIQSGDVKSYNYTKQFGGWNGLSYDYNLGDSGQTDFYKVTVDNGMLATDYLTQEIQNWLSKSIIGTGLKHVLYLVDGTNYPIKIVSTSFNLKQSRFEDLIAQSVKFKASNSNNSPLI